MKRMIDLLKSFQKFEGKKWNDYEKIRSNFLTEERISLNLFETNATFPITLSSTEEPAIRLFP